MNFISDVGPIGISWLTCCRRISIRRNDKEQKRPAASVAAGYLFFYSKGGAEGAGSCHFSINI
ncbi:hypothetical protein GCM10010916_38090 [Paenibacillus abyssi]|uniref:Uncharacterized protein n=1 Tax=Paenibacillus abyssi TaxID=1340531 RepID=A0A917G121_9BACL|nr:hypothetical protein GCM10010916_38090 [Paenibacillus abyssi]